MVFWAWSCSESDFGLCFLAVGAGSRLGLYGLKTKGLHPQQVAADSLLSGIQASGNAETTSSLRCILKGGFWCNFPHVPLELYNSHEDGKAKALSFVFSASWNFRTLLPLVFSCMSCSPS